MRVPNAVAAVGAFTMPTTERSADHPSHSKGTLVISGFLGDVLPCEGQAQAWRGAGLGRARGFHSQGLRCRAGALGSCWPRANLSVGGCRPSLAFRRRDSSSFFLVPQPRGLGSNISSSWTSIFSAIKRGIRSVWFLRVPSILKF